MASDILIIDDEADIRELVSGILQDDGHQVRAARDSDEALDAMRPAHARRLSCSTSGCKAAASTASIF